VNFAIAQFMKTSHTRRQFLQTSALAAGAGLTVPAWLVRAQSGGGAPVYAICS
jgi:hypothetical protein